MSSSSVIVGVDGTSVCGGVRLTVLSSRRVRACAGVGVQGEGKKDGGDDGGRYGDGDVEKGRTIAERKVFFFFFFVFFMRLCTANRQPTKTNPKKKTFASFFHCTVWNRVHRGVKGFFASLFNPVEPNGQYSPKGSFYRLYQ